MFMRIVRHKLAQLLCAALFCGCAGSDDQAEVPAGMDMNLDGELAALSPEPDSEPVVPAATSGMPNRSQPSFGSPEMPGRAQVAACPVPDYDGSVVTRADCDY